MSTNEIRDQVTLDRWQSAQQWERDHWVRTQRLRARFLKNYIWRVLAAFGWVTRYRGDDWNFWWKNQFEDYQFLPESVGNALEVGCGPYTNLRLIRERCEPKHLVLSDPLIWTYVRFKLTMVADMYRRGLCTMDDHALEEIPFASNYFDLVVMINVLDHVRDARVCMENAIRVTRTGGHFILGQDLTNQEDLLALKDDAGEAGHPIKLDQQWFAPYLEGGFEPVVNKLLTREQGRAPQSHYATLIFAGRKK